jgi:TonB family protein
MQSYLVHPAFHRVLFLGCLAVASTRASTADAPRSGGLDAPWKIIQTQPAIFPPRLVQQGVSKGEARIRLSISKDSDLLDALVIFCTRREFGEEALRTVKLWRYRAALERGEPIGVVGDVLFTFLINGTVGVERRGPFGPDDELPGVSDPAVYRAESLKNLDAIPTPTHVVPPSYPLNWSDRGIRGTATVEFYIDEEGRVRIPVVSATDHPLLGGSALAAVMQWRFEAPVSRGRRVLVRAEQLFTFEPPKK